MYRLNSLQDSRLALLAINSLIATLKPQSNGPSYSNTDFPTRAEDCTFFSGRRLTMTRRS